MAWLRAGLAAAVLGLGLVGSGVCEGAKKPKEADNPTAAGRGAVTAENLTDEDVAGAMRKAVDYLLKQRKGNNWESDKGYNDNTTQRCGKTGLVVYALLNAGRSLGDTEHLGHKSPELAPSIEYLMKTTPEDVYGVSLHAIALSELPESKAVATLLEKDRAFLLAAMMEKGIGYTYKYDKSPEVFKQATGEVGALPATLKMNDKSDPSNTQMATLAMWALADAKTEVPTGFWTNMEKYWRGKQQKDGGWTYYDGKKSDDLHPQAMAMAGLASMYILQEELDRGVRNVPTEDKTLTDGVGYVNSHFVSGDRAYYYIYGVERVGRATGLKFFGTTNWYRAIGANLVNWQKADGRWDKGNYWGEDEVVSTSFALLFLARGRNPVLFNKLQYGDPSWNTRPRDAANATAWMTRNFEHPVNWQVVNLQVPAEEWLDAPVLLITGAKDPKFTDDDLQKLRAFVEAGGTVFSTADGASGAFTEAMRKAAAKVVGNRYEMRELPTTHPLYKVWLPMKEMKLLGMSNGAREVWIHSPADVGAAWQGRKYAAAAMFNLAGNLYLYVNGKGTVRPKLQTLAVSGGAGGGVKLTVGRVEYPGNWNPEPGAWPRLARVMRKAGTADMSVEDVKIGELDAKKTRLAVMTGTTRFTLPEEGKAKLKAFVENGGLLLADATGGSEAFTGSFLELLKEILPTGTVETIGVTDPLLDGSVAGSAKVEELEMRVYSRQVGKATGKLVGVKVGGKWAVVFSDSDVTSGLLGTNTWGIDGLKPSVAEAVAGDVVLFVAKGADGRK